MDILEQIYEGQHDAALEQIIAACKARAASTPIKVGDRITISDQCHPQYWRGVLCDVTGTEVKRSRGVTQTLYICKPVFGNLKNQRQLAGTKMSVFDVSTKQYKFRGMRLPRELMVKVNTEVNA